MRSKEQVEIGAETSNDERCFHTARHKSVHVFAEAFEDTICAVVYLLSGPKLA